MKKWFWRVLAMLVGVPVLGFGMLVGGDAYNDYRDRQPAVQQSLGDVALGMTRTDVLLLKGKPDGDFNTILSWESPHQLTVGFDKQNRVDLVCTTNSARFDNGMAHYYVGQSAKELRHLGSTFNRSVTGDSLAEVRTWPNLRFAAIIEAGKISQICVTLERFVQFTEDLPKERIESVYRSDDPGASSKYRRSVEKSDPSVSK